MKKLLLFSALLTSFFLLSCSESEDDSGNLNNSNNLNNTPTGLKFDYEIYIISPSSTNQTFNDTMPIEVKFTSNTGETVHYIKIRIYNKADNTEIYKKPSNTHIDDDSGSYNFKDDFMLTSSNGISANTDWVLEAKVWGTSSSEKDVIRTKEFHINSN